MSRGKPLPMIMNEGEAQFADDYIQKNYAKFGKLGSIKLFKPQLKGTNL
jgi:hypothetical protein